MKLPKLKQPRREYELRGQEIIRGKGSRPEDRLQVAEVLSWQGHPEMVFDMIQIQLAGGQEVVWLDKHDELKDILRHEVPSRESSRD